MITVKRPTAEDFHAAFPDVRREDMAEWYAGTGELFHMRAMPAVENSEVSLVALDEAGRPLCFWGGDGGRVWLFATTLAVPRALSLHRILRPELMRLHDRWGPLYAFADARNTEHHKWMRWLGFEEIAEIGLPPFNLPFKTFTKEPPCALIQSQP